MQKESSPTLPKKNRLSWPKRMWAWWNILGLKIAKIGAKEGYYTGKYSKDVFTGLCAYIDKRMAELKNSLQ